MSGINKSCEAAKIRDHRETAPRPSLWIGTETGGPRSWLDGPTTKRVSHRGPLHQTAPPPPRHRRHGWRPIARPKAVNLGRCPGRSPAIRLIVLAGWGLRPARSPGGAPPGRPTIPRQWKDLGAVGPSL